MSSTTPEASTSATEWALSSTAHPYAMSSFTSWGVPGSMELKPEITAPGGSIYSVDGSIPGGKAYELMSGTSMAAPQVAGMAALAAQYIRANKLDEKTGLTVRALSQSLLMSTATPLLEEDSGFNYYPVLRQGAGLANIGAVTTADSYILMAEDATSGAADGKVKAELKDDPERTGVYSTSFTLNNLTDKEQRYTPLCRPVYPGSIRPLQRGRLLPGHLDHPPCVPMWSGLWTARPCGPRPKLAIWTSMVTAS